VEYRYGQDLSPFLDEVAEGMKYLGFDVSRWTHDGILKGRGAVPPMPSDVVVTWYGNHPAQNRAIAMARSHGSKVLFMEYAWWDRETAFQMDPCGTNGRASWARWPKTWTGLAKNLPVRSGALLVTLQGEYDATSKRISPWFSSNAEFVEFLCRNSKLPVVIRPHPYTHLGKETKQAIRQCGAFLDDKKRPIEFSLEDCAAVATLTSQCGVLALERQLPVLVYGMAAFRCPGAVFCMDGSPLQTQIVTGALRAGVCNLSIEIQAEVLATLRSHVIYRKDLPQILKPFVETYNESYNAIPRQAQPRIGKGFAARRSARRILQVPDDRDIQPQARSAVCVG
jgi:hypothetical protein